MKEENITIEDSERFTIKSTDSIRIVREVNVGGYVIPYEITINYKDLPKGNEDFYLDILTKIL
jgi:hypothetical protein